MLVSGPTGTRTTPSFSSTVFAMKSIACPSAGFVVGAGRSGPVEPALAVHVRGGPLLADERAVAADVDRDVRAVDELEDLERVRRRLLERLIPRDGGDAEHLDLG